MGSAARPQQEAKSLGLKSLGKGCVGKPGGHNQGCWLWSSGAAGTEQPSTALHEGTGQWVGALPVAEPAWHRAAELSSAYGVYHNGIFYAVYG